MLLRVRRHPFVLLAVFALLAACGADTDDTTNASGDSVLVIATTVAPLTNIAANIGGERVDIRGLVPEGVNSHTFEPPPSAAVAISEADIILINGLGLETPVADLAAANQQDGALFVQLGDEAITEDEWIFDFSFPREGGKPNPHLWTNPLMVGAYAEAMAEAFTAKDPKGAATYAANLAAYLERVDAFDVALRAASETVPLEKRKLLTYHDAYAYFARDYNWSVIGAIQPSDFEEPTAAEVAKLIDQVRVEKVPAIFGSEVFPSPVLEQIAAESGAVYIADLRDDDLPGKAGEAEHTLLELLRFNFTTMVEALGGDASALKALDTSDVVDDKANYA